MCARYRVHSLVGCSCVLDDIANTMMSHVRREEARVKLGDHRQRQMQCGIDTLLLNANYRKIHTQDGVVLGDVGG